MTKKRKLLCASIALYAIALVLPAFTYTRGGEGVPLDFQGWQALTYGWVPASMVALGMPFGLGPLAWFANPLVWLAWFASASKSPLTVLCAGAAALCAAGLFLSMHRLDAGDTTYNDISVGLGYFVWLASIIMAGYMGLCFTDGTVNPGDRDRKVRYVDW